MDPILCAGYNDTSSYLLATDLKDGLSTWEEVKKAASTAAELAGNTSARISRLRQALISS